MTTADQHNYNQQRLLDMIDTTQYHTFPGTTTVVCCVTLHNGFCAVGDAVCADKSRFDEEEGERIAFQAAMRKIRMVDGYHRMCMRAAWNGIGRGNDN